MKAHWKTKAALTALVFVLAFFENCSAPTAPAGSSDAKSSRGVGASPTSELSGNGQGYDGMQVGVYENLTQDTVCADGSHVIDKIEVTAGAATLTRRACTDITPQSIGGASLIVVPNNSNYLIYENKIFQTETGANVFSFSLYVCVSAASVSPAYSVVIGFDLSGITGEVFLGPWTTGKFPVLTAITGYSGSNASGDHMTLTLDYGSTATAGTPGTLTLSPGAQSNAPSALTNAPLTCFSP